MLDARPELLRYEMSCERAPVFRAVQGDPQRRVQRLDWLVAADMSQAGVLR